MAPVTTCVRFGEFRLDTASGELTRGGRIVPLEHQPSLVLARLATSSGVVVTREEIASLLWGETTHVKFDDGLNYCIRHVRAALGDDPRSPRFIETIPRRGYRFSAAVTAVKPAAVAVESRPNHHHEIAVSIARAAHALIF